MELIKQCSELNIALTSLTQNIWTKCARKVECKNAKKELSAKKYININRRTNMIELPLKEL